jgi:hypothetical protein
MVARMNSKDEAVMHIPDSNIAASLEIIRHYTTSLHPYPILPVISIVHSKACHRRTH